jgi:serine/threonine-protein kinase
MADLKFLAEEWPTISRRLDEALSLGPGQRYTWLAALDETDSVKEKLHRLLLDPAGVETGDFLGALPQLTLGPADIAEKSEAHGAVIGALIGPYRLMRELGVGGMGRVWLAERVDGGLKRQVALKLPHLSWSRGLAERMSRERDILASLDHPNIARIYDAGLDEHGRPYLALEYVEGEAIDLYCRRLGLPVQQRLMLVLQVARAVAHAHARLVVHRDLKPANILVTAEGQVRLLDFGIAKLMEGELTRETRLTQQGGRALTLDYASPEQIRGEPIGTASDVYSLGVVAYELLAEAKPYQLKRESAAALEEAIASVDVRLASAAATSASARRALQGDLDAILNKALKKNIAERYPAIEAFAQDIERHLASLPVQAQADALGYRMQKFVRRNRLAVAAGVAVATAVVAGAGVALWQANVAAQQRDRAFALLSRSNAVAGFLGMFVTESAQSSRPMKLGDILARSEALAEKEFRDMPEDLAVVLAMLGTHYRTLGEVDKAEALLKRALVSARDSNDTSLKAELTCKYATVIEMLGRVDEARRDLQITANRSDIDAETAAQCFSYLAFLSQNINDGPSAVDNARRALERLKASKLAIPAMQASLTGSLAYGLHLSGRNDEASREFAAALRMIAQLGTEASPGAITIRNNWGIVSLGSGDVKSAIALYDETLALLARSGGGEPPSYVLVNRARALDLSGRYSDAASAYALALAAAEKAGSPKVRAASLLGMGSVARELGDLRRAQMYLQQVERLDASARPKGGPVALAEHNLRARIALSRGDLPLARAEFTLALGERPPNWATIRGLTGRAEVAQLEGQLEAASNDAQDALRLAQSLQGGTPHSVHTGLAWLLEGEIRARTGATAASREAFASAVTHLTHTVDASHPALKRARNLAAQATPAPSTR